MWKLHSQNRLFTAIRQWCRQGKFTYAIFSFDKTKTYANFTIECTWFQNSDFDWSHTIRRKVASSFFVKRCVTFLQWRVRLLFLYALLQFCITEKKLALHMMCSQFNSVFWYIYEVDECCLVDWIFLLFNEDSWIEAVSLIAWLWSPNAILRFQVSLIDHTVRTATISRDILQLRLRSIFQIFSNCSRWRSGSLSAIV